ncbi:MAG: hypothetical protein ACYC35_16385 [Pirellulales bacterium]
MVHGRTQIALVATAFLLAMSIASGPQDALAGNPHAQNYPQLFTNYYVPAYADGVGAELYLCPRPTPPLVGHTYITYQPLMPHEFLYKHSRSYRTYHPDAGWTRTYVSWR